MLTTYLRQLAAQSDNSPIIVIGSSANSEPSTLILGLAGDKQCASTFKVTQLKSREPSDEAKEALREFRNNWVSDIHNSFFCPDAIEKATAKAKEEAPLIYIPGLDPKLDEQVDLLGLESVIESARKGSYARAKPTGTTEECIKAATETMGRAMQTMHCKADIPVTPTPHEDTRLTINIEQGAGQAEAQAILHHIGLMGYRNITVNEVEADGNVLRACGSLRIDEPTPNEVCVCGECSLCKIASALKEEAKEDVNGEEEISQPTDGAIYAAAGAANPMADIFGDIFGDIFQCGKKATPELISKVGTQVRVTDAATLHLRLPRGVANPEEVGNWSMADYAARPKEHLSYLAGTYTVSRYWEKYGFVTLVSACEKQHVVKVKLSALEGIWVV